MHCIDHIHPPHSIFFPALSSHFLPPKLQASFITYQVQFVWLLYSVCVAVHGSWSTYQGFTLRENWLPPLEAVSQPQL